MNRHGFVLRDYRTQGARPPSYQTLVPANLVPANNGPTSMRGVAQTTAVRRSGRTAGDLMGVPTASYSASPPSLVLTARVFRKGSSGPGSPLSGWRHRYFHGRGTAQGRKVIPRKLPVRIGVDQTVGVGRPEHPAYQRAYSGSLAHPWQQRQGNVRGIVGQVRRGVVPASVQSKNLAPWPEV